jgi:hypothetical protein
MNRAGILVIAVAVLGMASCDSGGSAGTTRSATSAIAELPPTEVPDAIVGAWEHGTIDFALWENYKEGHYASRNATPTREAMTIAKNGDAKFYRYEFAFGLYEELVDCEGTVDFHGDGTFTFRPAMGRKRYFDTRHSKNSKDRALADAELNDPRWAGKRRYTLTDPVTLQITVPGSAPYNWYKKR